MKSAFTSASLLAFLAREKRNATALGMCGR